MNPPRIFFKIYENGLQKFDNTQLQAHKYFNFKYFADKHYEQIMMLDNDTYFSGDPRQLDASLLGWLGWPAFGSSWRVVSSLPGIPNRRVRPGG